MEPDELVKLEISRCGLRRRDLRLMYIGSDRNKITNRESSLQHTHYSYIRQARTRNMIICDRNSIVFKDCGASGVKLVDGRHYTIEFAPGRGRKAQELTKTPSLPGIQLAGTPNGTQAIKFENTFSRRTWNESVSSIPPATTSYGKLSFSSKPKAKKREPENEEKRESTKRNRKRSQELHSGLFCFW